MKKIIAILVFVFGIMLIVWVTGLIPFPIGLVLSFILGFAWGLFFRVRIWDSIVD